MNRRIFGIETEYGLNCSYPSVDASRLDAEAVARILFSPLVRAGRGVNVFLPNGGRIYLDVGAHPEYATAECDRVEELLAQVLAGDRMFADLARQADEALAADGVGARVHLLRTNEDNHANAFGCHENYSLRRTSHFREVADALVSFFVTRQILTGAGHLRAGNEDGTRDSSSPARFGFSGRSWHIDDAVSSATTRSRPIINTRDEPLADPSQFRRLHVIVGDTNISQSSTALKIVMTDLMLSAIENGVHISDLALADPLTDIRRVDAHFLTPCQLRLVDGRVMTAVELQRELRSRILDSVDLAGASPLTLKMVDLWQRGLDAVESGDWQSVSRELDWAVKYRMFTRFRQRSGATWDDPRLARLELAYHDTVGQTLAGRMEQSGELVRLVEPDEVSAAMDTAPTSTRAHLRGKAIAAAWDTRADLSVDWMNLRLDSKVRQNLRLTDPFGEDPSQRQAVEAMIEQMQADAGKHSEVWA
ncbi:MAG: proteasome accessory factor PafA2 family protein [Actinomycetaceae bacterium]|nr:proteasome accessory factor PafA2 family protein [Actinomycetaceae bacterium]